jgi:hypothetical protein
MVYGENLPVLSTFVLFFSILVCFVGSSFEIMIVLGLALFIDTFL